MIGLISVVELRTCLHSGIGDLSEYRIQPNFVNLGDYSLHRLRKIYSGFSLRTFSWNGKPHSANSSNGQGTKKGHSRVAFTFI
jgi:hypothetical protein